MVGNGEYLDSVFAECLRHHPEGWAPYEQVNAQSMRPGEIGYIDTNGKWRHIANLLDPTAMNMLHWEVPKGMSLNKRPGLPIGGGIQFTYNKAEDHGAILIADGNIEETGVEPLSKINQWMSTHAKQILEKFEDTQENGIWVITGTYVAQRSVIAAMTTSQAEFSWSVSAEAAGMGRFAPGVNWLNSREEGSWKKHLDPDGVVLFFSGIQWDPHRLYHRRKLRKRKSKQKFLDGDEDDDIVEAIEIEVEKPGVVPAAAKFKLVPQDIGKVNGRRLKAVYDSDEDEDEDEEGSSDEE